MKSQVINIRCVLLCSVRPTVKLFLILHLLKKDDRASTIIIKCWIVDAKWRE